jgi:endonuclease/exonuclease/phosphatase (EEP) superfamily protein YafD
MAWLDWLVRTLALVPIALTVLPLWRTPKWWVRLWDYPRLQLAVWLAVMALAELALLELAPAGVLILVATFACLAWQLAQIWRYTRLAPRQVQDAVADGSDRMVSVLIANILQTNRESGRFLAEVGRHDPDLVLVVETDRWWQEQLTPLEAVYPHRVLHPLDNTYGMLLYSRLPLSEVTVRDRVSQDIPSISAKVRLRSGQLVHLHCVHPEPPQVDNDVEQRDAELLLVAEQVAKDGGPTIVCGDLNDVAWSHTTRLFQRISGLLDPRVGRGLYPTFHADHWFARWPLDHLFHDTCFRLVELRVLGHVGSDHFPVLVRLRFDPDAEQAQAPAQDEPTAADHEEARESIAEGFAAERAERSEDAGRSGPGGG